MYHVYHYVPVAVQDVHTMSHYSYAPQRVLNPEMPYINQLVTRPSYQPRFGGLGGLGGLTETFGGISEGIGMFNELGEGVGGFEGFGSFEGIGELGEEVAYEEGYGYPLYQNNLAPFLVGGLTGALLAKNNQSYVQGYPQQPYYAPNQPIYQPYYQPYPLYY